MGEETQQSMDTPQPQQWDERITPGRFEGETVIVTGAGAGIGRAVASRVAREGGRVVACDLRRERLDELCADLEGMRVEAVAGDVSSEDDVAAIVDVAGDRVHALVNNAGIMDRFAGAAEVDDETWQRVFRVNVDGVLRLTRAVLPGMLAAGAGRIVNVSSEAALRGSAAGVAYTASKHAVDGITRSTAVLYGPGGVRCNAVAPGATITSIEADFTAAPPNVQQRLGPLMAVNIGAPAQATQLAATITFLASDDSTNVNGVILPSDGGWSAI